MSGAMEKLVRTIDLVDPNPEAARDVLRREWLLTNGLGGYAAGTISGNIARRHHGMLIAALPARERTKRIARRARDERGVS